MPDAVHAEIDELPRHMQMNEKNKTTCNRKKNAASYSFKGKRRLVPVLVATRQDFTLALHPPPPQ